MTRLPTAFSAFLKLLSEHDVRYLLIGGYAVGYYGYPCTTADMDVWIACDRSNAEKMVAALKEFGFGVAKLKPELFLAHLKQNKRASGRHKDLDDLQHLP